VYLRASTEEKITSHLVFAKLRLNPVKKLTIPRLELLGILIGSRALKFVQNGLQLLDVPCVLYTDSKCAFYWVQSPKKLDKWVSNRVAEIRQLVGLKLRFVPSEENPADWATRGKPPSELTSFWWNGPEWLQSTESSWPDWDVPEFSVPDANCGDNAMLNIQEINAITSGNDSNLMLNLPALGFDRSMLPKELNMVVSVEEFNTPFDIQPERYPTFQKVLRITVWCVKFICRLTRKKVPVRVSAQEMAEACEMWEKSVQLEHFPHILEAVRQNKKHEMMQLGIVLDKRGLLVCSGRLGKADIPDAAKWPILLSKKSHFSILAMIESHKRSGHAGAPQTLAHLRQRYWIPASRDRINRIVSTCFDCIRGHRRSFPQPRMPELPTARVTRNSAFTHTGIDFFGPMRVRDDAGDIVDVSVCLFTCLTVRAVHLELVEKQSTEYFLHAIRRFIARRGKPDTIVSDNAKSFKLADKVLGVLWASVVTASDVLDYCANQGIQWNYITEYAPWMGGVYERAVGIVKRPLRKVLGKSLLSIAQLRTVLCEVEAVVNSRPLCFVGEEPGSTILTPNHFLSLLPKNGFPVWENVEDKLGRREDLRELFVKGEKLVEEFWQRWSDDYLLNLRSRTRYDHKVGKTVSIQPEVDQVVIIKDPSLGRGKWRLGRIEELLYGHDNQIRSARVRLPSGRVVGRPIRLLSPVECNTEPSHQHPLVERRNTPLANAEIASSSQPDEEQQRPKRAAAIKARQNWTIVLDHLGQFDDW
jgi:hypothetical protein